MRNRFQSIFSCSMGNILEWYDFGLFTIFSSLFSRIFFPADNAHVAAIETASIFAIGFMARPFGALIFGYLGDTYGRARTLRLSILSITIPTLMIGILPTYQQIGVAAPLFLMLIRIIQGISIGGEYSGNLIYLAETAPERFRATFTTFASMGSNLGILLASFVGMVSSSFFSIETLENWGWRIPYLLSGLLCLLIYQYRLNIPETNVFIYLKRHHSIISNPIKTVFTKNFPQLCRTLGMVCMGSTFYYFCFVYLPLYLSNEKGIAVRQVSAMMICLMLLMIILVPLAGLLCDYVGRKKMLLFNSALVCLIVIPGFYFIQSSQLGYLLGALMLFVIASTLEQGATPVSVIENFPAAARYTGVSLGYNLGNGLLGGTVPMVCAWLASIQSLSLWPAIYIAGWSCVTFLVVYFFIPSQIKATPIGYN